MSELSGIPTLTGRLTESGPGLVAVLSTDLALYGELTTPITIRQDYPIYDGVYVVTPMPEMEQVLLTYGTLLEDDVSVLPIPYSEVSNTAGGLTVHIG